MRWYYCYPHFIDEKTEAGRCEVTCPRSCIRFEPSILTKPRPFTRGPAPRPHSASRHPTEHLAKSTLKLPINFHPCLAFSLTFVWHPLCLECPPASSCLPCRLLSFLQGTAQCTLFCGYCLSSPWQSSLFVCPVPLPFHAEQSMAGKHVLLMFLSVIPLPCPF